MQIAQPEMIHECLLHRLVQNQKSIGLDAAPPKLERLRHVTIDINML
jgi:hypothetical protein